MRRALTALLVSCALTAQMPLAHATKAESQGTKKAVAKKATTAQKTGSANAKKSVAKAKKPGSRQSVASRPARKPASQVARRAGQRPVAASNLAAKSSVARKSPSVHAVGHGADDPARLAIESSAALVIDQVTGRSLVEKQADSVVPIASITKLMTAMVVLDAGLRLDEVISISEADIDYLKGTRSRMPIGARLTRETAMLLALMSSENRAANALGRHYPGGLPAFVRAMNRKAQEIGMTHSRFEEPTGLSSANVASARDLARLVAASANYPEIQRYSTTPEAEVELAGRVHKFVNTNALVRNDSWQIGVSKTGYISEAGRCLVMQARVADKPVVIVLLDSQGKMTRVGDANRIRRWMESASVLPLVRPT